MTTLTSAPASVRTAVTADPTLPGTLALTGLTLAAAVGMGRLFADASYLVPFVAAALVPHAVCWTGRRLGASLPVTVLVALAALVLAAAWMVLPETTIFGIPWTGTLRSARLALSAAASQFADVVAPTEVTEGFLLAGMIGVGLAAILGDWGAFRVRALFEAAIPSFTLFIFTATLGASRHRGISVALYLAALLLFLLVQQAWLQSASASWFASRSASRLGPRLRGGAAVGGVAVVAALVIGPNLPGADRPPVLAWRGSAAGAGGRTTVSPLVDIRGRLVDQSDVEVFRVRSNVRAYWRLTSLDRFDGEIWSSNDTHRPVDQRLPGDDVTATRRERAVQDFTITGLSSIWLPAAYEPERVEGVDDVSYNDELSSLITRKETSDGLTYRVESSLPRFGADELRQGAPVLAGRSLDRFLRLPAISPAVRGLARQAAGTGTPFQKARALQDFFQRRFTYDLEARPGHDQRALENFLFRTKRGYCEQFAGAYAVMARTIGLPTRVAVGFTPGEPGQDGRYHVRDLNAHAWPEVHLQGFGWVAFEPTPGRGAPGAEAYTGLPEAQAQIDDPSTATTLRPSAATSPPAAAAPGEDPGGEEPGVATTVPSGADEGGPGQRSSPLPPAVRAVLVLVLSASVVLGAIPLAKHHRRQRRRAAAATPGELVQVAWAEATEALGLAGATHRPADTLDEHARRAAAALSLPDPAAAALADLARDTAAASYGRAAVAPEVAVRAARSAAMVETALRASASAPQRLRRALDPRPLLAPTAGGWRPGRRRAPSRAA